MKFMQDPIRLLKMLRIWTKMLHKVVGSWQLSFSDRIPILENFANCADPVQMPQMRHLISVYTVCLKEFPSTRKP